MRYLALARLVEDVVGDGVPDQPPQRKHSNGQVIGSLDFGGEVFIGDRPRQGDRLGNAELPHCLQGEVVRTLTRNADMSTDATAVGEMTGWL